MQNRVSMQRYLPEVYKLMIELDGIIKSGIPPLHLELIKMRVSQLNGCPYCINKHIHDTLELGKNQQRVDVLSVWREAYDWFSEEERVMLQIAEEVMNIGGNGISDDIYDQALALLGGGEAGTYNYGCR